MHKIKFILSFILILLITKFSYSQPYSLVNAFSNLSFTQPIYLTHSNDGTNRIFVVQKNGLIKVFSNDSNISSATTYLDISSRIITSGGSGEQGLLGLAFHPNYANNGYFYVYYVSPASSYTLVIARYKVSAADPNVADFNSEQIILTIPHPTNTNHNGGCIFFGLDGYLYMGTGDGGSGGDPPNNAQNTQVLLGKILRINIDSTTGSQNYVIPPTNPFYNSTNGKGEIFAWGMRNPWRFGQDRTTGIIWCADVGQGSYEELDIIENGNNYGWRCYEGMHSYNLSGCGTMSNYIFPLKEYTHAGGNCSVTGGFIYRGSRRPDLVGGYIYGDYCSKKIWKFKYEGGVVLEDSLLMTATSSVLSFGMDQNNELYVLLNNGVYRFNKSDLVGINNSSSNTPSEFKLEQNYPNPFNPETNINYYIPDLSKVWLTIYDALGKEIYTLVNTVQMPGTYQIKWNGKDAYGNYIPSGAYFYTLSATNKAGNFFNETKRMIMLK